MHHQLEAALAPAWRDLTNTCRAPLVVRESDWAGAGWLLSAMVWSPDGSGTGISIVQDDLPLTQAVSVADQLQDIAIEALWASGLPVTWPECPRHPDSHPLQASIESGQPVWRCPNTDEVIAAIGELRPLG